MLGFESPKDLVSKFVYQISKAHSRTRTEVESKVLLMFSYMFYPSVMMHITKGRISHNILMSTW